MPLLLWQLWCLANIAGHLLADNLLAGNLLAGSLLADGHPALHWLWQFAACFLLRQLCLSYKDWQTAQCSRDCRQQLRTALQQKLAAQGAARSRFGPDGALSTLLTEQVDALDGYISRYWPQLFLVVWTPLLIVLAVSLHSWLAAVLFLLTAPLVPFFMILVGREASKASSEKLTELSRLGGRLLQFVRGLTVLRRLNAVPQATAQLAGAAERYRASSLAVLRLAFLSTAVLELFSSLAIALVALYLGLGLVGELPWAQGEVAVSFVPALFILLLAPEFYQPLRQLGNDYHAKAQAEAAALALEPLWQLSTVPLTAVHGSCSELQSDSHLTATPQPLIRLQQVQVGGEATPVRLSLDTLEINAGTRYWLRGDSGSGKSTLLQLLAGFAEFSGTYQFAGVSISPANRAQLWPQVGYLTQQPELLAGTVADNLRLVRSISSALAVTDAQLLAVLAQVGLLAELGPAALSLQLGEQGQGLSGGQQQRLCLARLLLADQPLWLLDEPFAELDHETTAALTALLEQLSRGRTVLIASHQGAGLQFVDGCMQLASGVLTDVSALSNPLSNPMSNPLGTPLESPLNARMA